MVMALSSMVLISSQVSSWTKPTWLASMKQGSHIMLQRLVRSMVSTEPRPSVTVDVPWLCSLASLWARDVAARKNLFQVLEERGIDRHHVFKVAMDGAVLDHQDLAVALDDLRLDLADLLVEENFVRQFAIHDLLANLRNALRTERVGGTRPAQGRLFLLVGLQQGLVAPLGGEAGAGADRVQLVEHCPTCLRRDDESLFHQFCWFLSHVRFCLQIRGSLRTVVIERRDRTSFAIWRLRVRHYLALVRSA